MKITSYKIYLIQNLYFWLHALWINNILLHSLFAPNHSESSDILYTSVEFTLFLELSITNTQSVQHKDMLLCMQLLFYNCGCGVRNLICTQQWRWWQENSDLFRWWATCQQEVIWRIATSCKELLKLHKACYHIVLQFRNYSSDHVSPHKISARTSAVLKHIIIQW